MAFSGSMDSPFHINGYICVHCFFFRLKFQKAGTDFLCFTACSKFHMAYYFFQSIGIFFLIRLDSTPLVFNLMHDNTVFKMQQNFSAFTDTIFFMGNFRRIFKLLHLDIEQMNLNMYIALPSYLQLYPYRLYYLSIV